MKELIKTLTFSALITIAAFLTLVLSAHAQEVLSHETSSGMATDAGCGDQSNGLQLCVSKERSNLKVEFRNLRAKPLELSLGFKLGNGDEHPNVKLVAEVGDKQYVLGDCFSIHGQMYPWAVRIRSGDTFSMIIDLKHYCLPEIDTPHWLTVEYTQPKAQAAKGYWSGTVRSSKWWIE